MRNAQRCVICSNSDVSFIFKKDGYNIVKCQKCNLVFTDVFPSGEELDKFYAYQFDYVSGFKQEKAIRIEAKKVLKKLKKLNSSINGNLLDIGCGAGFFLDEAKKMGFETFGVEISKKLVEHARKKGHKIVKGDFYKVKLVRKKFSIIILSQVIEHLTDPISFIWKIHKYLSDGGIFYLSTPNIESVLAKVQKEDFSYMIPPEHLFFYSPKTIKLILEENGFEVLSLKSYGYSQDLAGIIKQVVKGKQKSDKDSLRTSSKIVSVYPKNPIKRVKYMIFDKVFCRIFYKALNFNNNGSIIEVFAKKA